MNPKWFGDDHDLVKWSVLLRLAERYQMKVILQICFRTKYEFPEISFDDDSPQQVPSSVRKHFRSLRSVEWMSRNVSIRVFCQLFEDRESYVKAARKFMAQFEDQSRIVFLDPDIGPVPRSGRAKKSHVTKEEAQTFWQDLEPKDILVLYQHHDHTTGWIKDKKKQFLKAIGGGSLKAHIAQSKGIPGEVAFYYVRKD